MATFTTVSGEEIKCPSCGSSDLRKAGKRTNSKGEEFQKFRCKRCGKSFSVPMSEIVGSGVQIVEEKVEFGEIKGQGK